MSFCRLAVDIGGTFTDVVLKRADGSALSTKVLTTHEAPQEGVLAGITEVMARGEVPPEHIEMIVHGTTLATNAIIERRGVKTALLTTEGFRDSIEFAFEHRYDQSNLMMERPEPLVDRTLRFEIAERHSAIGDVLLALDEEGARRIARKLIDLQIESVAISFIHAYQNPAHELRVAEIVLEECPGMAISLSHQVCPEIREYERTSTTVANAYVQPIIAGYLSKLAHRLAEMGIRSPLLMIMSSGSLTTVETAARFPIRLVESGPAGGAILGQQIARELNEPRAIAFDMGGTTAKVVMVDDFESQKSRSLEVARVSRFLAGSGFPLRIPVIDMVEIGAGGGSLASVDKLGRIAVGPESAGSSPGPACYGLGGTRPAVTDADFIAGKISGEYFASGKMQLDRNKALTAIHTHVGAPLSLDDITAASGILEIVDENMANAVRVHATDQGKQVEDRVLIATGGAGPLHAARIAKKLGINKVVIPKGASVGSAHGFLMAPIAYEAVSSRLVSMKAFDADLVSTLFRCLRAEAEVVVRMADTESTLLEKRFAYMRYRGQGHELAIELPVRDYVSEDADLFKALFEEQYRKNYSRTVPTLQVEALTWSMSLTSQGIQAGIPTPKEETTPSHDAEIVKMHEVFDVETGTMQSSALILRESMRPGSCFVGPATIVEEQTTTYVPSGFVGRLSTNGHLILSVQN